MVQIEWEMQTKHILREIRKFIEISQTLCYTTLILTVR